MSFIKNTTPQKEDPIVSYKCCAYGCPLNGSISTVQNKWTCSFHFRADSENWSAVTSTIRNNEPIFGILDDLRKISEIEWASEIRGRPAQRELYMGLFDDEPELKPRDGEHKSHYEYRLMDHISIKAGVLAKQQGKTYMGTKILSKFSNPADALVHAPQRPFIETEKDDDFL